MSNFEFNNSKKWEAVGNSHSINLDNVEVAELNVDEAEKSETFRNLKLFLEEIGQQSLLSKDLKEAILAREMWDDKKKKVRAIIEEEYNEKENMDKDRVDDLEEELSDLDRMANIAYDNLWDIIKNDDNLMREYRDYMEGERSRNEISKPFDPRLN